MTHFKSDTNGFLPLNLEEGKQYYKKFSQFDLVFITGDPYYDHPLSGVALLSRLLDRRGYKVGIIAQPQADEEYLACGRPRYFFCITSGLLDSMLANYTPMLHERENVLVPERALIKYTQKVKELFKGSMTVLGGVEATIRRFTHFDYKDNMLRRGILNDSKADLLLYGQAERPLLILLQTMAAIEKKCQKERKEEHADGHKLGTFDEMRSGLDLFSLDGAVFRVKEDEIDSSASPDIKRLPSYEECVSDKNSFRLLTLTHYLFPDSPFIEPCGKGFMQHNRSSARLTEKEMDYIYASPFTRKLHPSSKNIELNQEAVEKLENSVIIGRGCWGGCSFCIIPLVQQKELACRSRKSILKEVEQLYQQGVNRIDDLTIPTLNMFGSYCKLYDEKEIIYSPIINKKVTVFRKKKPCNQHCVGCTERVLNDELSPLLEDIAKLQKRLQKKDIKLQKKNLQGEKCPQMELELAKLRPGLELRSAVRHDIILQQEKLFSKIMEFTSRLKIAPEHVCDSVLKQMNKGTREDFERFLKEYKRINNEQKTDKNLVPYFIAAHPGCTMDDMKALRKFCTENKLYVNLTQIFTPTPGTASTATYYTALDTFTGKPIYVPRTFREKKDQKNILLFAKEIEEDNVRQ